jgi:hypothetical protein
MNNDGIKHPLINMEDLKGVIWECAISNEISMV